MTRCCGNWPAHRSLTLQSRTFILGPKLRLGPHISEAPLLPRNNGRTIHSRSSTPVGAAYGPMSAIAAHRMIIGDAIQIAIVIAIPIVSRNVEIATTHGKALHQCITRR